LSNQETIVRILAIEQEAQNIHTEAERRAARVIKEAEEAASTLREQTLAQTREDGERIVTAGQAAAEAEREHIIAQAEAEAQHMEATAAQHFDHAVNFVLEQVTGHK
jgi:vacuolar-type H+-ATPase subunit H